MATRATRATDEEASTPSSVTPVQMGVAHGMDPIFVWTQLTEMQKSLGAIESTLKHHSTQFDKVHEDSSKIKADVSEFKQIRHTAKVVAWVIGVVAAAFLGVVGFVAKESWSVLKPLAMRQIQVQSTQAAPGPQTTGK